MFYKADTVKIADGLPTAFLADDRTAHAHYDRVPHAFAFRTLDEKLDAIRAWVDAHDIVEKDFIILGDMNFQNCDELEAAIPRGYRSLNNECRATNTNVRDPKPYDHVMVRSRFMPEVDKKFDFRVYNLIEAMRPFWNSSDPYPGGSVNPIDLPVYDHDRFRALYSDHHPVVFKMTVPAVDDD